MNHEEGPFEGGKLEIEDQYAAERRTSIALISTGFLFIQPALMGGLLG